MQQNPYASPKTDARAEPPRPESEPAVVITGENPYLPSLFNCRRYALQAMGLFILLVPVGVPLIYLVVPLRDSLGIPLGLLLGLAYTCQVLGLLTLLAFFLIAAFCWFFVFMAAHHHAGLGYALGHLIASALLTPVLLAGIILIPILIRGDIERAADQTAAAA